MTECSQSVDIRDDPATVRRRRVRRSTLVGTVASHTSVGSDQHMAQQLPQYGRIHAAERMLFRNEYLPGGAVGDQAR